MLSSNIEDIRRELKNRATAFSSPQSEIVTYSESWRSADDEMHRLPVLAVTSDFTFSCRVNVTAVLGWPSHLPLISQPRLLREAVPLSNTTHRHPKDS